MSQEKICHHSTQRKRNLVFSQETNFLGHCGAQCRSFINFNPIFDMLATDSLSWNKLEIFHRKITFLMPYKIHKKHRIFMASRKKMLPRRLLTSFLLIGILGDRRSQPNLSDMEMTDTKTASIWVPFSLFGEKKLKKVGFRNGKNPFLRQTRSAPLNGDVSRTCLKWFLERFLF